MDSILNTLITQTFHFFRNEAVTIAGVCLAARGWPGCWPPANMVHGML